MEIVRWLLAVPLLAVSLLIAFGQMFAMAYATRRLRADPDAGGYSCVPLVGGLIGTVGALIAPHETVQRLWWVPLIVDPGCALMFGAGLVFLIGHLIRRDSGPPTQCGR